MQLLNSFAFLRSAPALINFLLSSTMESTVLEAIVPRVLGEWMSWSCLMRHHRQQCRPDRYVSLN